MLTNAGKAIVTFPNSGDVLIPLDGSAYPKCSVECKDTTGTTHFFSPRFNESQHYVTFENINQTAALSGIYIGSGNTPATADDYTLESQITSGLTVSSPTKLSGYDAENNECTLSFVITLSNTSGSDITVNEVGTVARCYYGSALGGDVSGTSSSYRRGVLLDRTVLDSPVVIEAGGSAVLHYTFRYPGYTGEE